jgi:preprotein translocase subunit SecG
MTMIIIVVIVVVVVIVMNGIGDDSSSDGRSSKYTNVFFGKGNVEPELRQIFIQ